MNDEAGKTPVPTSPSPVASPAAPVVATPPSAVVVTPPVPALLSISDFQKLALRIGVITEVTEHPNADRLLVLKVDVGDGTPRQVVAGIKGAYQPADLMGKRVVVVTNLKPATLRGVESQGMVLATQDSSGLSLVVPERSVQPGSTVK